MSLVLVGSATLIVGEREAQFGWSVNFFGGVLLWVEKKFVGTGIVITCTERVE